MDPILTTVATGVLVEGTKFLYQQAAEVLKTWRVRRLGKQAEVAAVPTPEGVTVGEIKPLPEPRDRTMEDMLADLRDRAEVVATGVIDPSSAEARTIVSELRDYLEVVMGAPITFAGEEPRAFEADRVSVVTERVEGAVTGVDSSGAAAKVSDVSVATGAVGKDGKVIGARIR